MMSLRLLLPQEAAVHQARTPLCFCLYISLPLSPFVSLSLFHIVALSFSLQKDCHSSSSTGCLLGEVPLSSKGVFLSDSSIWSWKAAKAHGPCQLLLTLAVWCQTPKAIPCTNPCSSSDSLTAHCPYDLTFQAFLIWLSFCKDIVHDGLIFCESIFLLSKRWLFNNLKIYTEI